MRSVTVLRTGPQALVQDRGRPGYAHLGVPPSGALDLPALELANRLVGNPPDAAGIEALLGGVTLRADTPCLVAVTGAPTRLRLARCPVSSVDATAEAVDFATAIPLSAGDVLRMGTPSSGLRCYLAVSGGIAVRAELGSRSTDVLSGIGPDPLTAGDVLPLGPPPPRDTQAYRASGGDENRDKPAYRAHGLTLELPVLLGPRDGWFDDAAAQLAAAEWTVSPTGNRIGVWLTGTTLRRTADVTGTELPTEGVVAGAVQVPPAGEPVIFLSDHPTTGGYPVIAVVHHHALPLLAQTRPGTPLRLRPTPHTRQP